MSSFKRGVYSYILGFVFSPLLTMLFATSTKTMTVAMAIVSLLFIGGIGIVITKRKPGFIFIYCWGLVSGLGVYGPFFAQ